MKRVILQRVFLLCTAVLLLTSCLNETGNKESGQVFGVIRFDMKKGANVLDVGEYQALYHIRFINDFDDDCYWVAYEIDYDAPENSADNNIGDNCYVHTINLLADPVKVEKWGIYPYLTDTTSVLTGEIAIKDPILDDMFNYVKGKAFMFCLLNMPKDQKMSFNLSYDMKNLTSEDSGYKYYNVYLRASIRREGEESKIDVGYINAFEMRSFLESAAYAEKALGKTSFRLKFHYLSEIDSEGKMKWSTKDSFDIPTTLILPEEK
ncbi:MAG: hypothetical protein LBE79_09750 [Tannerella sp.]|jgi:hypothetical protein|nr:hypothetical protein [Tannerella sp.]